MLSNSKLKYRIVAETFEWNEWFEGDAKNIMEALRRAQESLTQDDIVEKTANALAIHLDSITSLWNTQPGSCDRLSTLLGFSIQKEEEADAMIDRRETAAKISALVLANAFIFQEQLALSDERVETLRKLKRSDNLVEATADHWRWIWENINYVPIFQLGERIINELPENPNSTKFVKSLLIEAQKVCLEQAALRHDLMGRIYHRLLHHAKYLGTYYTSVSSATLLTKLAFELTWDTNFGDPKKLADFKVADLACGTGTLLMAVAQSLTDHFIRKRLEQNRPIESKDLSVLHSTLMQNVVHGYDILPSAVHLTASTLALLAPEVAFRQMNLFVMPVGVDHNLARLGSLDFLETDKVHTQFSLDNSQLEVVKTGASNSTFSSASIPRLDLCVMNPPFVSSRYGNRLFGSVMEDRPKLLKELSKQARKVGISANAGLGALFVPLAGRHTKPGGRIAFVLPIALATGESWGGVRSYIANNFHLEIVISSHDPSRFNFSENTDLSELLFIARKLRHSEKTGHTSYVTLRKNPLTIHEALDTGSRILTALSSMDQSSPTVPIRSGNQLLGEVTYLPAPIGRENWTGAIFAQSYLAQVYWNLNSENVFAVPGNGKKHPVPLCSLDQLGEIGYDVRDISDAFEVEHDVSGWTPHPSFWNHDAKSVTSITQKPNSYLSPRTKAIPGRKLKNHTSIWTKAGKILLVSRLWPITHKVLAIALDEKVLGNTWWAFDDSSLTLNQRKALLLWINSTLGMLMYFGKRAITRSAWMQMKKPAWQSSLVLDVRELNETQLEDLAAAYDSLSEKVLRPLAETEIDPVRNKIDGALCRTLKLPSLVPVRELMSREPSLTGKE